MKNHPGKEIDIHKREGKRKSAERKLLEASICKKNKDLILGYVRHRVLADNLGLDRQYKYLIYLRVMAEYLGKPFDKATKRDIEELLERSIIKMLSGGRKRLNLVFGVSTITPEPSKASLDGLKVVRTLRKPHGLNLQDQI